MTHRGYLTLSALDRLGASTLQRVADYGYGRSPSKARVTLEGLQRNHFVETIDMGGEVRWRITPSGVRAMNAHRPTR